MYRVRPENFPASRGTWRVADIRFSITYNAHHRTCGRPLACNYVVGFDSSTRQSTLYSATIPEHQIAREERDAFDGNSHTEGVFKPDNAGLFYVSGTLQRPAHVSCAQVCAPVGCSTQNSGDVLCLDELNIVTNTWTEIGCRALPTGSRYHRRCVHITPPPAPPPPPGCSNTCRYAMDHDCDDGGHGAEYHMCHYGTDCHDCGPRHPRPPPPPPSPSPPPPSGRPKPPPPLPGPPPPDPNLLHRRPNPLAASARPARIAAATAPLTTATRAEPMPAAAASTAQHPTDFTIRRLPIEARLCARPRRVRLYANEVANVRSFVTDITNAFVMAEWATQFAIVDFARDAEVLTHLTSNRQDIPTAMQRYAASGLTSISDGLNLARRILHTNAEWSHRDTGQCLVTSRIQTILTTIPPLQRSIGYASDLQCSQACASMSQCERFTSTPCSSINSCSVRCDFYPSWSQLSAMGASATTRCGGSFAASTYSCLRAIAPTVVSDTCAYVSNSICDDGGPGAENGFCELGSDCTDCGDRPGALLFGQARRNDATPIVFTSLTVRRRPMAATQRRYAQRPTSNLEASLCLPGASARSNSQRSTRWPQLPRRSTPSVATTSRTYALT